jgi:hypothetical protein
MMNRKIPKTSVDEDMRKVPSIVWNVVTWVLALGAFGIAMALSYREIHYNIPNDLRSPVILLVDALLAAAFALGFALHEGTLTRWTDAHLCLQFGLWSAAVFRLLPPILNEDVLYLKNCGTFDVQYVVLGALIHGVLAGLLASPFAIRVLERPAWASDESLWELCGAVILTFFVVAGVFRLLAEPWWAGL